MKKELSYINIQYIDFDDKTYYMYVEQERNVFDNEIKTNRMQVYDTKNCEHKYFDVWYFKTLVSIIKDDDSTLNDIAMLLSEILDIKAIKSIDLEYKLI